MSEEAKPAESAEKPAAAPSGSKLGLLLGLVNTVAIGGLLGLLVFTKILYKRPKITEADERARLEAAIAAANTTKLTGQKATVTFEAVTANLKPTAIGVSVPGGPPAQLKPHYLNLAFSVELTDKVFEDTVNEKTAKFKDALLRELGQMTVEELSTVQGRFILRSKIAGLINEIARKHPTDPTVVSNVYFSEFLVQ